MGQSWGPQRPSVRGLQSLAGPQRPLSRPWAAARPGGTGGTGRFGTVRAPPSPTASAPSPNMAATASRPLSMQSPLPSAKMAVRTTPSPAGFAGPETRWGSKRRPSPHPAQQKGWADPGLSWVRPRQSGARPPGAVLPGRRGRHGDRPRSQPRAASGDVSADTWIQDGGVGGDGECGGARRGPASRPLSPGPARRRPRRGARCGVSGRACTALGGMRARPLAGGVSPVPPGALQLPRVSRRCHLWRAGLGPPLGASGTQRRPAGFWPACPAARAPWAAKLAPFLRFTALSGQEGPGGRLGAGWAVGSTGLSFCPPFRAVSLGSVLVPSTGSAALCVIFTNVLWWLSGPSLSSCFTFPRSSIPVTTIELFLESSENRRCSW